MGVDCRGSGGVAREVGTARVAGTASTIPLMARGDGKPVGLTASAARLDISDRKLPMRRSAEWQADAFAVAKSVPELSQSMTYVGNQMSKLRLFPAWKPTDLSTPVDVHSEDLDAALTPQIIEILDAEIARLRGETGGLPSIQMRMARNLDIVGECYLVGWEADPIAGTAEEWRCCSIREVQKKGSKWVVYEDENDKKGRPLDPETSTVIRIWEKDTEWHAAATSTIKGVLGEARLLEVLSQQVMAQALRAASNGFFVMPNDISFGGATSVEPTEGEEATTDPTLAEIEKVLLGPIEDPSDPNSVQPGLLRGPKESLTPDVLRHLTFWSKDQDTALEEKIDGRVKRIARGINLPLEVVMGHQETTFANAKQIDEGEFEDFFQPRSTLLVDGLTIGYYRPNLIDAGLDPDLVSKIVIWYDADDLIAQPDTQANADAAHSNFTISDEAYRKAKGFDEADAPDPLEIVTRAGLRRGILTAQLTGAMIKVIADEAGIELPSQAELAPGGAPVAASAEAEQFALLAQLILARGGELGGVSQTVQSMPVLTAARRKKSKPNYGAQLVAIDRDLRTRLVVAANDAMTRALERAGNVLRSKATGERDLLRNVPAAERFATLGPTKAHRFVTNDEALEGAWDELERQFYTWGQAAQADALETASEVAGGFSVAEREAYKLRQAADLDEAWAWLRGALTSLAGDRMFDPHPAAPEFGEFDATAKVPTGMLRQAIARAGGGSGLRATDAGGAFLTLADAGTRPAGGIGTGELLREAMRDHGVGTEAYQWDYGPAFRQRPFEPHMQLDGVIFDNFDDAVLTNTSGFPDGAFYMPGDHAGCICDFTPILLPVEVTSDEAGAA